MKHILTFFLLLLCFNASLEAIHYPFPFLESSWWAIIDQNDNNGVNGEVYALALDGEDLYVGGDFTAAGGVSGANYIAKFNITTSTWSALGMGANRPVRDICIVGSDVYVGGDFTFPTFRVAHWDGNTWNDLGLTGADGEVFDLEVGPSGDLYMGGDFNSPTPYLARWDGSSWNAVGDPLNARVLSISVSPTEDVYVGGLFTDAGGIEGADHVAKYDGAWNALGDSNFPTITDPVAALEMVDSVLYIGGLFVGGPLFLEHLVGYNTSNGKWIILGDDGLSGPVHAITAGESSIYIGGDFRLAGGGLASNIVEYDGEWKTLGEGIGAGDSSAQVSAIVVRDTSIWAGGLFEMAGPVSTPRAVREANNLGLFTITGSFPVDLLSFVGFARPDGHVLEWETTTEINSDHFEIQRQTGALEWTSVGQVPAKGASAYQYTCEQPPVGMHFYRLKMIDLDGSYEYSNIINLKSKESHLDLYPTLVHDRVFISVNQDFIRVDIYDMSGLLVGSWQDLQIDVSSFPTGMYQARLVSRSSSVTKTFQKR